MRGGDEIEIYPSPRLLERSPGAEEEEEEEGQKAWKGEMLGLT